MKIKLLIRFSCFLLLNLLCFKTECSARKTKTDGYIQPINQQQDWSLMKRMPAVELVKIIDVNYPYNYCKGIINGHEAFIEAIQINKHFSADSISHSYHKIEKGKYYLMALVFPLYPGISQDFYFPSNYMDVYIVSHNGKKIKALEVLNKPPKIYIAINMINNYVRPIDASDLIELPHQLQAQSNIPTDWLWPD